MLDPRVKSLPYLTSAEKAKVTDDMFRLMSEKVERDNVIIQAQDNSSTSRPTNTNSEASTSTLASLLGSQYGAETGGDDNRDRDELLMFELKNYIKEHPCGMSDNPLTW